MISFDGLTVAYGPTKPLDGVTCELTAPLTAIMGPSGSGKSTLLRVLAGLQTPDGGAVTINGVAVEPPTWSSAGDVRVALIHQDYRLVDFLNVRANLRLSAELRSIDVDEQAIIDTLDLVGLGASFLTRMPETLSGGEQQRVAIARALLCRVEVLLADEPTGALDRTNTLRVAQVLRDISATGEVRVVIATHDVVVAETASETYELTNGELIRA